MHSIISKILSLAAILSVTLFATPQAYSQWVQTGTLANPYVLGFGTIGTTLFAGTQNGIFRSTDDGTTWTAANTGYTGARAAAFAVQGSNLVVGSDSGIFLSTDMGVSWAEKNDGLTFSSYKQISAFAQDGNHLYAGGYSGIFLSTDGGTSWQNSTPGLSGVTILSMAAIGHNIFAGTVSGVYLSTNDGANWSKMSAGLLNNLIFSLVADGQTLYAGSNASVAFSTNNGVLWSPDTAGMSFTVASSLAAQGSDVFCGTWVQTGTIYHSSNAGANWHAINEGLPGTISPIYAVTMSGSNIYIGTNGDGVWRRPLSDFGISAVKQNTHTTVSLICYPNPFPHSATINYSSPKSGAGEVTIVNTLGQAVATLFEGELGIGEHSFTWDAKNSPNGTYFCLVNSNGHIQRTAMMLAR